jgi:hypothetical protein
MPQVSEFPAVGSPEDDLPSATHHVTDMTDSELAYNYQLVAKWQAYAEYAEGYYAAAELAAQQQLGNIKRQVYTELKAQQPDGKFKNAAEAEILVGLDPRVIEADDRYHAFKTGHQLHKANASAYGKYALTFAGERKDRREKAALADNNY